MKIKYILFSVFIMIAGLAQAQVEDDDLYFTAKDRVKLKAQQVSDQPYAHAKDVAVAEAMPEEESYVNPTDSYSAKTMNPEFAARSNAAVAQSDDQDYFINDYQYNTSQGLQNFNNNY